MLNNTNGPSNISPSLIEIIENDYILKNISPLISKFNKSYAK